MQINFKKILAGGKGIPRWKDEFILPAIVGLILIYFTIDILISNYNNTTGHLVEVSNIQERIRNKEKEYFYKSFFTYDIKGKQYRVIIEKGFPTFEQASTSLQQFSQTNTDILIWVSRTFPEKYKFSKSEIYRNVLITITLIIFLFLRLFLRVWLYYG